MSTQGAKLRIGSGTTRTSQPIEYATSARPSLLPCSTKAEIERLERPVLLEFGASWCGHCQALAPKLARLLEGHPEVHQVKIEDGPGKPLGRSFGVKLWPTLVFMKDGKVVKQVARPGLGEVREGLESIDGG